MSETMAMWPGQDEANDPRLRLYPASQPWRSDAAVLVLPGGGYRNCAAHEGEPAARKFNSAGLHAAVLEYRHAPDHRHPAPVHDTLRAVRLLRTHGWSHLGLLGFSAGGHLASTAAVHFDRFSCDADDLCESVSGRPDAVVLCYPVIDLAGAAAHAGSRRCLLGDEPDPALVELLSTHRHVSPQTPPTFIWHTAEDPAVPLDNALGFASACRRSGVPLEMHIYERGGHGLGLADGTMNRADVPEVRVWFDLATAFLKRHLQPGTSA